MAFLLAVWRKEERDVLIVYFTIYSETLSPLYTLAFIVAQKMKTVFMGTGRKMLSNKLHGFDIDS